MAGSVRGTDFNSWWQNRADYRQEASRVVDWWHTIAAPYAEAAAGAKPPATFPPPQDTDSLQKQGAAALASIASARSQLSGLEVQRQQAQAVFENARFAIQHACEQRVHAERAAEHKKKIEAAVRKEKSKVALRKFGSIAIFVSVMYILYRY